MDSKSRIVTKFGPGHMAQLVTHLLHRHEYMDLNGQHLHETLVGRCVSVGKYGRRDKIERCLLIINNSNKTQKLPTS